MKLTAKQKELYKMIATPAPYILAYGGARAAKTFAFVNAIILRAAKHPNTDHIILRLHYSYAKNSIVNQTIPSVLSARGGDWRKVCELNKTDLIYTFLNGSRLWVAGVDDRQRMDKVLGSEYATIFLNEISQMDYSVFELMKTRLNAPGKSIRLKMFFDCNPGRRGCWDYQIWQEGKYPDGREVERDKYKCIHMTAADNPFNSADYLDSLKQLTPAMQTRFLKGEYGTDETLLFRAPAMDGVMGEGAIMHIDAAYGGNDTTALTIGDEGGNRYGRVWTDHVQNHIGEIRALFDRYHCRRCFVETNGDKGYLARELERAGISAQGYHEGENKVIKIASWLYPAWGKLHWEKGTDNAYMNQILDWYETTKDKDDAPDSAACIERILGQGITIKMVPFV